MEKVERKGGREKEKEEVKREEEKENHSLRLTSVVMNLRYSRAVQSPQWMRETIDSTECCVYCFFLI